MDNNSRRRTDSSSQNRRKYKRKKKKRIRWDKIFIILTAIMIVLFVIVLLIDLKKKRTDSNTTQVNAQPVSVEQTTQEPTIPIVKDLNTVCIDAGHGGADPGAGGNGLYEKDNTLAVALEVQKYLEKAGINVVMTRTTDKALELDERVAIADWSGAAVLVSIHRNSYPGGNDSVKGIEAWTNSSAPQDAIALTTSMLNELEKVQGAVIRGVKSGTMEDPDENYRINRSTCTSCILELGFMNSPQDNEMVTTGKSQCAKAIADGIVKYLNQAKAESQSIQQTQTDALTQNNK